MVLGGDDLGDVGVPEHQVRVGAHRHTALPGVQVEKLGCVGAGHRHKVVLVHLTGRLRGRGQRSGGVGVSSEDDKMLLENQYNLEAKYSILACNLWPHNNSFLVSLRCQS